MKLTKEMQEFIMAQAADAAAPFRGLANEIGLIVARKKAATKAGSEQSANLWDTFKMSLSIAHGANMDAGALRLGLAVACTEANVPAGSFRSYVGTIGNMYADVIGGGIGLNDALAMTIKDARERYQDAEKKALREARARLAEETKDWTAEALDELTAELKAAREAAQQEAEAKVA